MRNNRPSPPAPALWPKKGGAGGRERERKRIRGERKNRKEEQRKSERKGMRKRKRKEEEWRSVKGIKEEVEV